MGWMIRGFETRQRLWNFLFTVASRPALRPTQPPIQWVPRSSFPGVKRPRREATLALPQYAFMAWWSIKAQGQLYLYIYNISVNILFKIMEYHLIRIHASSRCAERFYWFLPPIQCVPGALSLGVMRPGPETDPSPISSADQECVELCLHSSNTPTWLGAQFKHRDNFTFYIAALYRHWSLSCLRFISLTHYW
jgi:hypothetical protein